MIFRYSSHSIGQFIIYFYLPRVKGSAKTNRGKKERNEERTKALKLQIQMDRKKKTYWMDMEQAMGQFDT